MVFLICPECNQRITDPAATCPNCGHPLFPPPAFPSSTAKEQSKLADAAGQKPSTDPDVRPAEEQTTKQGSSVLPWLVWLLILASLFLHNKVRKLEQRLSKLEEQQGLLETRQRSLEFESFKRRLRPSPSRLEPSSHSASTPQQSKAVSLPGGIAPPERQPPNHSGLSLQAPLASTAAAATSTYWMNTVYHVEASDFGASQPDRCTVGEMLQQFRDVLTKAKEVPTQGVDPELVKMVHRHITECLRSIGEGIGRSPKATLELSLEDAQLMVQAALQDNSILERDPSIQASYELFTRMAEIAERQSREKIAMQVRLAERHKGHQFPLPGKKEAGNAL